MNRMSTDCTVLRSGRSSGGLATPPVIFEESHNDDSSNRVFLPDLPAQPRPLSAQKTKIAALADVDKEG